MLCLATAKVNTLPCDHIYKNTPYIYAQNSSSRHVTNHLYSISNVSGKPEQYTICYGDKACFGNTNHPERLRTNIQCEKIWVYPGHVEQGERLVNFAFQPDWLGWCIFNAETTIYSNEGVLLDSFGIRHIFVVTRWGEWPDNSDRVQPGDIP